MTTKAPNDIYGFLKDEKWRKLLKTYCVNVTESWRSRNGFGMNAELIRKSDKKKIAEIQDDGRGGAMKITRFHKLGGPTSSQTEEYEEFNRELSELPSDEPVNDEIVIAILADIAEMKKISEKKKNGLRIVYVDKDDKLYQYDFPKGTSIDRATAHIREKMKDAMIVNEVFA